MKSFGNIVTLSSFPNNEPQIPNVPYVTIEWSDKLSNAKSTPEENNKNVVILTMSQTNRLNIMNLFFLFLLT